MLPLGSVLTYMPLPAMKITADIQNTQALSSSGDVQVHNKLSFHLIKVGKIIYIELRTLTQRDHHEGCRNTKSQRVALTFSVNTTLLTCAQIHTNIQVTKRSKGHFNKPVSSGKWTCYTSENGGDESGEEAAAINTQIEHREECTPLPRLYSQESKAWRWFSSHWIYKVWIQTFSCIKGRYALTVRPGGP